MPAEHALDASTRRWLLNLARRSIAAHLEGAPSSAPQPQDIPRPAQAPRGCFVTLHTNTGQLRGCIGTFEARDPLWQNVQEMAVSAAYHDPRFAPLAARELPDCVLEISALTERIAAEPGDVKVGEHGLSVSRDAQRGVLLPQVAVEQHWDRETFISRTCVKAGLPADAWRDGSVQLQTFTAEVFSEPKI